MIVLAACSAYIDLVFIIDSSGSIQWERVNYVRQFLASVVNGLDIGPTATQVGAVYFSTSASVAFTLSQYNTRQDVAQALLGMPYIGNTTSLADAQRKARTGIFGVSILLVRLKVRQPNNGRGRLDIGNTLKLVIGWVTPIRQTVG
jgi:von Willebrand factor type A domain